MLIGAPTTLDKRIEKTPSSKAAICTDCAFGLAVENCRHAGGIFASIMADQKRRKNPLQLIVPSDVMDPANEAINKVTGENPDAA